MVTVQSSTKASSRPNVFRDDSDAETMEVIEGVFLTEEQLEEIVEKYGTRKQAPQQSESDKIRKLR